ncbi:MAG TPA: alkane 1-monooxygenase [Chitinophagaceae bacterium]
MKIRAIKYAYPFVMFVLAWIAFGSRGWLTFLPVIWSYAIIPLMELLIKPDSSNLDAAEEEMARNDRRYDFILYATVPLHYASMLFFLFSLQQPALTAWEYAGRILSMGLLCGVFGINVAHELGHRVTRFEQTLAKIMLLSSQYMHFFIEHNKGHHKRVATREDPASARLNESLFQFYARSIVFSYLSAWEIQRKELRKKQKPFFSIHNEMLVYLVLQVALIAVVFLLFGWLITLCYLAAAGFGIGLLEAVNYIEHYGLSRRQVEGGRYERAMPVHSWNSDHIIGRLSLFELSRHSDHHFLASRKYQVLRHHADSPQMPTGYPGMIILAHFPPLFFRVMKKQMKKYKLETT